MKKIYYEVLEYHKGQLKDMNYFALDDIMHSKKKAEDFFKLKRVEAFLSKSADVRFDLVLVVLDDYETNRYVISSPDENIRQLESMILSGLTGQQIDLPQWKDREAELMHELKIQS